MRGRRLRRRGGRRGIMGGRDEVYNRKFGGREYRVTNEALG
jgi:hypothetical protein